MNFLTNRVVKGWSFSPYGEGQVIKYSLRRRNKNMNHKLKISVSKESPKDGIVSYKKLSLKKKLFKKLFGDTQKVTIIIPGDSVHDVTIREVEKVNGGGKSGN